MTFKVGIIDLETGNIGSLESALIKLDIKYELCKNIDSLSHVKKIILPGVGSFGGFMSKIKKFKIDKLILKKISDGCPLLGICVGFQALFDESNEMGNFDGLKILSGRLQNFSEFTKEVNIPHVGWNECKIIKENPLFESIENNTDFYFTHSYFLSKFKNEDVVSKTNYGLDFVSAVKKRNIYGVQFHPEKSQAAGLKLLNNFYNNC